MNIINNLVKTLINITHAVCIIIKYKVLSTKDKMYIKYKMHKVKV